jgi:hypothetical protein
MDRSMKFAANRAAVRILCALAGALLVSPAISPAVGQTYDLRPAYRVGDLFRTDIIVELKGELSSKPSPDADPVSKPFKVSIKQRYDECILETTPDGRILRSMRYYTSADGDYRYGDLEAEPTLAKFGPDWLLFDREGAQPLVCPRRLVFRQEMEMLDVPGNPGFVADLLPKEPVAKDATWPAENTALTKLLVIDAVSESDVATRIDSVDGDNVSLVSEGEVAGAASGVATDVNLRARTVYSLKERRPLTFAMTWREVRSIAHAEPGFDVTATIRLATSRIDASEALADDRIEALPKKYRLEMGLLKYESPSKDFRFVQDRRWFVTAPDETSAVLKLIDRGELVAQCSLVRLPPVAKDDVYSLDDYKAEVQEKLGESFGRFVDTREFETKKGVRVMKLHVDGMAQDLEMRWIYYHLSEPSGRHVAMIFVYEPQFETTFGDADRWVVENFEFLPVSTTGAAEAEAPASEKPPAAPAASLLPGSERR